MADAGTFCPPAWKAMRDDYRSVVGSECIFWTPTTVESPLLCSAACGTGAAPACLQSEAIEKEVRASQFLMLGWSGIFRSAVDESWACLSDGWTGYAPWAGGVPPVLHPDKQCAIYVSSGLHDSQCLREPLRCLCTSDMKLSPNAVAELSPTVSALRGKLSGAAAVTMILAFLVALSPAYYLLIRRCLRSVRKRTATSNSSRSALMTELEAAQDAASSVRVRVSFTLVQGSLLIFLPATFRFVAGQIVNITPILGPGSFWIASIPFSFTLMLLSILPTDASAIRAAGYFFFSTMVLLFFVNLFSLRSSLARGDPFTMGITFLGMMLTTSVAGSLLTPLLPCIWCYPKRAWSPRASLLRVWLVMRLAFFAFGLFNGISPIGGAIVAGARFLTDYLGMGLGTLVYSFSFILCSLVSTPANRGRVHRFLGSLGAKGSQQQQAASIAALVGGVNANIALANAEKRFTILPLGSLTQADLTSSMDTGLNKRTKHAQLGECDAFMSHAWCDDGVAKYASLQEWAKPYVERGQGMPSIWLDKACIDQGNIDASLASLPVFLPGCKTLLILPGPGYTSRLWCVMEVFTYLRTGGTRERIISRPIAGSDALAEGFLKFDAAKAKCYHAKDRQKLLAVIEAGFGDLTPFNAAVRELLAGETTARPAKAKSITKSMVVKL